MKATVEDISSVKKRIDFVIPREKVTEDLDAAYNLLRKNARIKGFRPGKAPRPILERMYKGQVEEEVINNMINEAYPKAIEEQDLQPLGMPTIDKGPLTRDNDFTFSATLEVAPKVEPHDYLDMELKRQKLNVTDEMVEKQLEMIQSAHAQLKTVEEERPLKEGDTAIINYQGYEDDHPLEKVKNENFPVALGLNRFNEELEKALVGVGKGEKKSVDVTFPSDFTNAQIAGKTVRFDVEVIDIKEKIIPELDDEFAKDVSSEFQTLDDLKKKIREQLTDAEEQRIEADVFNQIREKLVASHQFEVPASLVDYQIQQMISNMEQNLRQRGLNFEAAGMVPEKLADEYKGPAEERVKSSLVLDSIARKESIKVEDDEVDAEFEKIASQIGQKKDVIEKFYRENNMIDNMTDKLLEEKTLKYIVDHGTIAEVEAAEAAEVKTD